MYKTGTMMIQGEQKSEWLKTRLPEILKELAVSNTPCTEHSSIKLKTDADSKETAANTRTNINETNTDEGKIINKQSDTEQPQIQVKRPYEDELIKPQRNALIKFKLVGGDEWRRCKVMASQPTWKPHRKYVNHVNIIIKENDTRVERSLDWCLVAEWRELKSPSQAENCTLTTSTYEIESIENTSPIL